MPASLPPTRQGGGLQSGEPGWNLQGVAVSGLCIGMSGLKSCRKMGQWWGKVWRWTDAGQRRGAEEEVKKGQVMSHLLCLS